MYEREEEKVLFLGISYWKSDSEKFVRVILFIVWIGIENYGVFNIDGIVEMKIISCL